ncbi:unnamed protein product [Protopolystoma xenopodis]|uniref:Uncharacterized protein n=1 Tax=Protopolystoma xenopodis TaxID=117903 RepID=A0A3S5AP73_9PLAT|nr:unnamed protein product [Protopolystoma xenopodis]
MGLLPRPRVTRTGQNRPAFNLREGLKRISKVDSICWTRPVYAVSKPAQTESVGRILWRLACINIHVHLNFPTHVHIHSHIRILIRTHISLRPLRFLCSCCCCY